MFKRIGRLKGKPRVFNPKADFALKFNMITKDEYLACLKGDMDIQKGHLIFNANAGKDVTPVPLGAFQQIFIGRAEEIAIRKLLGLDNT